MQQSTRGWAPPGIQADHSAWRYDLKKGWQSPGEPSHPNSTQYVMDASFDPSRRGALQYQVIHSPKGTPAPRDEINYTPATGEVHDRGVQAPVHHHNVSLVPVNPEIRVGSGQRVGKGADETEYNGAYDDNDNESYDRSLINQDIEEGPAQAEAIRNGPPLDLNQTAPKPTDILQAGADAIRRASGTSSDTNAPKVITKEYLNTCIQKTDPTTGITTWTDPKISAVVYKVDRTGKPLPITAADKVAAGTAPADPNAQRTIPRADAPKLEPGDVPAAPAQNTGFTNIPANAVQLKSVVDANGNIIGAQAPGSSTILNVDGTPRTTARPPATSTAQQRAITIAGQGAIAPGTDPTKKAVIQAAAAEFGISPDIFDRQITQEGGYSDDVWNFQRNSGAGAQGPGQFMPGTAASVAAAMGVPVSKVLSDPVTNVRAAAFHMKQLLGANGNDYAKALAAYNAGQGTVNTYGGVPPESFANGETFHYVNNILGSGAVSLPGSGTTAGGTRTTGAGPQPSTFTVKGPNGTEIRDKATGNLISTTADPSPLKFDSLPDGSIYLTNTQDGTAQIVKQASALKFGNSIAMPNPQTGVFEEILRAPANIQLVHSADMKRVLALDPNTGNMRVVWDEPEGLKNIPGVGLVVPPGGKVTVMTKNGPVVYGGGPRGPHYNPGDIIPGLQSGFDNATHKPIPPGVAPGAAVLPGGLPQGLPSAPGAAAPQQAGGGTQMPAVPPPSLSAPNVAPPGYRENLTEDGRDIGNLNPPPPWMQGDPSTGLNEDPNATRYVGAEYGPGPVDDGSDYGTYSDPMVDDGSQFVDDGSGNYADYPDDQQYVADDGSNVGGGQDAQGWQAPVGKGAAVPPEGWTPPIDPSNVVGGGNQFGDQVSMEGVHKGVDLQAVKGTPTVSPVDGVVLDVTYKKEGLGLQVLIQDSNGQTHRLSHLDQAMVKPGQYIKQGQPVASVGETGTGATGPHLDYRVEQGGQEVDPSQMMGPLAGLPPHPDTIQEDGQVGTGESSGGGFNGGWQPPIPSDYEIDAYLKMLSGLPNDSHIMLQLHDKRYTESPEFQQAVTRYKLAHDTSADTGVSFEQWRQDALDQAYRDKGMDRSTQQSINPTKSHMLYEDEGSSEVTPSVVDPERTYVNPQDVTYDSQDAPGWEVGAGQTDDGSGDPPDEGSSDPPDGLVNLGTLIPSNSGGSSGSRSTSSGKASKGKKGGGGKSGKKKDSKLEKAQAKKLKADIKIDKNKAQTERAQIIEQMRANQAKEFLQRSQIVDQDRQNALNRTSQRVLQGTFAGRRRADLQDSALKNPWVQSLTGMAPEYGSAGGPGYVPGNTPSGYSTVMGGWTPVAPPEEEWEPIPAPPDLGYQQPGGDYYGPGQGSPPSPNGGPPPGSPPPLVSDYSTNGGGNPSNYRPRRSGPNYNSRTAQSPYPMPGASPFMRSSSGQAWTPFDDAEQRFLGWKSAPGKKPFYSFDKGRFQGHNQAYYAGVPGAPLYYPQSVAATPNGSANGAPVASPYSNPSSAYDAAPSSYTSGASSVGGSLAADSTPSQSPPVSFGDDWYEPYGQSPYAPASYTPLGGMPNSPGALTGGTVAGSLGENGAGGGGGDKSPFPGQHALDQEQMERMFGDDGPLKQYGYGNVDWDVVSNMYDAWDNAGKPSNFDTSKWGQYLPGYQAAAPATVPVEQRGGDPTLGMGQRARRAVAMGGWR